MQHSIWYLYSQLKNGLSAHKKSVIHPKNSLCVKVLKILYTEGYINGFRIYTVDPRFVEIFLKYNSGKPVITKLLPLSKPGRRLYCNIKTLWKLPTSVSTVIVSTSQGVFSDKECRKRQIGGELLCLVS